MLGLNNLQIVKKMNTKNLKNERPNLPKSNQERPKTDHNGQKKPSSSDGAVNNISRRGQLRVLARAKIACRIGAALNYPRQSQLRVVVGTKFEQKFT